MEVFITLLIIIVSLVLGIFVLVQNPKGGGLATGFTGGAQLGGVQKTADFLEKGTWYMMILLFALCIISAKFSSTASEDPVFDEDEIELIESEGEETATP